MRIADLFCGEGGAAAGYVRRGHEVHGYDSNPKLRDRYLASGATSFTVADATEVDLTGFDMIHASPPCKDHNDLAAQSGGDGSGWMLPHTIQRVRAAGVPYVVENVEGAEQHMNGAVMLCGSMFGLGTWCGTEVKAMRWLRRHRLFITSFAVLTPPDQCSGKPIVGVYGTGGGGQMTRGYKATTHEARVAMVMPWASRDGVSQAVPPAFTEYLAGWL